ncbi:MAG: LLM class F420-dependent oxidoreductase [Pseudomonadota bacterium]
MPHTRSIGTHFPQAEIGSDHMVIRDFVQAAEEQGFSHINVPDHVLQTRTPRADFPAATRYTTEFPHHETLVLLAFIAGITQRLILKSAVLILPQRQAALVAKQAAELDVLSGGRFQLGVGLGWNTPEYEALNMDYGSRASRFVEQIEVCRRLWTEQHVTYRGEWHTIEDAGLAPMPIQQPIPVWIGAFVEPAILRAAQIGDGWQAMMPEPNEAASQTIAQFKTAVEAGGRDPDEVGVEATIFATGEDPERWAEAAREWFAIGATQVMFRPQGDFATIERAVSGFAPLLKDLVDV